ncbi:hypothetical protein G7Y89_g11800 [Cudoniella acicularis]|uniref:ZW10 C-terminal helical domain-containing protein n=1 Tax=Cudoniella acicularis TaxID=354080 RepID=A0A8H4RA79_9HELO|nr:hypothetical protein G7Y89_g11800 [Cudoniella acicularis]
MSSTDTQARVGEALVEFSSNGHFPEEESVSAAYVEESALSGALEALEAAKAALGTEIKEISRDSAPDVDAWISHAQTIQDDIEKSRRLASGIVRQAEADELRLESLEEQETYVAFLSKEMAFNEHLGEALRSIQEVNIKLDKAEELAVEKKITEAMALLEGIFEHPWCGDENTLIEYSDAWVNIAAIPSDTSVRAMRILDTRSFDLRAFIHEQFESVWNGLVQFDLDQRTLTVNKSIPSETMTLDQAMVGLKAYKEVESAARKIWDDLDHVILKPRTELRVGNLPSIQIEENRIRLDQTPSDNTIKSLFVDLENIIRFLVTTLPPEFIRSVSDAMMPTLSARIKEMWLDTAVPASLDDMVVYQKALLQVSDFATNLDSLKWPGANSFHDWVSNVPRIWLNKRRETSLDWIRNQLALGIGVPRFAERVEKRMVPRDEGFHITATGTMVTDDWDAAWDSGEDDTSTKAPPKRPSLPNKNSTEEARRVSQTVSAGSLTATIEDEDDGADAWGWGDEDATETSPIDDEPNILPGVAAPATNDSSEQQSLVGDAREMTLSEKYWTSSMPQSVLATVVGIYNDGAILTQPENEQIPVTPAAPGLFSLPILILAMYRAVSPSYYANEPCGNMYLYNDAMWLSDQLRDFASEWKQRKDLSDRAYGMVKLDPEIKALESFGKRAYTNELITQRTIIKDLLGGTQNFLQQDKSELEHGIKVIIKLTRDKAAAWLQILPWSACASALGSLVNTVATKLISDIFDLTTIGVDDAERIATILSKVESLDDLFIKPADSSQSNGSQDKAPKFSLAAQFVDKWLKMNYLNQVLQSNLADIKFLWSESELSYYFTVEEVVELIGLSFENNHNVRQTVRDIQANPHPKAVDV